MRFLNSRATQSTSFVLLTPKSFAGAMRRVDRDPDRHQHLLRQAQRLRGSVYLADGAIQAGQLTNDGRHIQPADSQSWHLLTLDYRGAVVGCTGYRPHSAEARYEDLVSRGRLSPSPIIGDLIFVPRSRAK